jgi:glycine cleavage system T protein
MSERTPLYEPAATAGAVFAEDAGWLMPAHYGHPDAEYDTARTGAVLFDISHRGKVEAAGLDAAGFLHNLSTNDIKQLPSGAGCEAFLTTGQARVVAYVLIFHLGDAFWLDVAPATAVPVIQHLEHFHIAEQVDLADRTRAYAQLHLAGPDALAVLARTLGGDFSDMKELGVRFRPLNAGTVQVRRHRALGMPGYDLLCPSEQAAALWQALNGAGAQAAGLQVYQTLRVEAGMPLYGVDIDDTNLPQEVGRTDQAVSFTKGCYIGQETVARIRTYGHVNRSLVGLKLSGDRPVAAGARLLRDGQEVGKVTSSVVSPLVGTAIALAYVRRGSQEPGTALEVETAEGRCAAEVTAVPFGGTGAGVGG